MIHRRKEDIQSRAIPLPDEPGPPKWLGFALIGAAIVYLGTALIVVPEIMGAIYRAFS